MGLNTLDGGKPREVYPTAENAICFGTSHGGAGASSRVFIKHFSARLKNAAFFAVARYRSKARIKYL